MLSTGEIAGIHTFRDAAELLTVPELCERAENALLARPWFAVLYERRRDLAALSGVSTGTRLGAAVRDFEAHYGLVPSFFPAELVADARPLELAAWLLARDHDLYHVLCEYETSDHDEIALQSFLCAQSPCVFGGFVSLLSKTADLQAERYKHLRDLLDAEPDLDAAARGRRARPLLALDFTTLADRSLPELRRLLAIEPPRRAYAADLRNTCSGRRVGPYFGARDAQQLGIKRSRPHIRVRSG